MDADLASWKLEGIFRQDFKIGRIYRRGGDYRAVSVESGTRGPVAKRAGFRR
jgi:hypothetical protein